MFKFSQREIARADQKGRRDHYRNRGSVFYDVEIARAVEDKLSLKPKFIEASWDAMLAAFDAGKADTVFNQVSITEERKKKYDYSVPYMT